MKNKFHKEKSEKHDSSQHFFREVEVEFLIHELKDPLSIIQTGTRTLLEKKDKFGALSARQEKTLNRILRNSNKARAMLNSLLETGRSDAGSFFCCNFQPAKAAYVILMDALGTISGNLCEELGACSSQRQGLELLSNHGIFFDIAPPVSNVQMYQDETKFTQIIGNLIKNALHHRKERVEIKVDVKNNDLIIDVIDDGPGIDSEHHQVIFQRYKQVRESSGPARRGHGLGLAGALIMAKSLGGNIELRSKKGRGATFRLILPVSFGNDDR
ncbi:MAG: HAMP domain-containing histidine kinase [Desulfobacterales bacterium]|nr:HAMP domain-containing histidine kinase [Deltaproteobacteria bacterium]NNL41593.1 HAMP domain-containing histidine kinase [Desulfobacterales bacterium]